MGLFDQLLNKGESLTKGLGQASGGVLRDVLGDKLGLDDLPGEKKREQETRQAQPEQQERPAPPTAPVAPAPAPQAAAPKFCTNCGAKLEGGKFCTNCGAPVQ